MFKAYIISVGDINFLVVSLLSFLSQYTITLTDVSLSEPGGEGVEGGLKSIYKEGRINMPTVNKMRLIEL